MFSKSKKLALSKYCCFFFFILFFCRNRLEFVVANRIKTQISEKTNDLVKEMKKYTFRNRWSSLQKTLTELFEKYYQDLCFFFHVKKSRSRHRIECMKFEVVWYNCRTNIKNKDNSTSHFDWMQKDENVRKKSSNFASRFKTLQLRNAIVKIMFVVTCEVFSIAN